MNSAYLGWAVFIAAAFVGWPIIGHYSKANGGWVSVSLFGIGTVVVIILSLISKQIHIDSVPGTKAISWLFVAAVLNGVAAYVYAIKASDQAVATGTFVVLVSVLMAVWAPIFDWALNGNAPTLYRGIGFGFAVIAIYFLK